MQKDQAQDHSIVLRNQALFPLRKLYHNCLLSTVNLT